MDTIIELTLEQEKDLMDFWNLQPQNPPGVKEIANHVLKGNFDGRSAEVLAIKKALTKLKLGFKPISEYISKTDQIELTEEQTQFIINNSATMNSLEIAKELFKNPSLTNLHKEVRAVNAFRKTLDTRVVFNQTQDENIPDGVYVPPATLDKILKKVNKYVNCSLTKETLKAQQKKNLEILINYLHTFRFIKQMNTFTDEEDRTLCEDSFIRSTYDKPDLQQEEVDQYIEYAHQVVQGFSAIRLKNLLQKSLEENTKANTENPELQRKSRMDLVESIGKVETAYHQCMQRQEKLLNDLKVKRSKRLDSQIAESASILNLIQAWRHEETRNDMIKLAEYEQENVKNEVERLISVPEIKARIMGLNKDGILNG